MSIEKNKELVRQFYDAIQKEDYDAVAKLCHKDFVFYHQVNTPIYGAEGFVESEKKNFDSFRGFKFPIEALLAEGDQVAVYLTFEGTHTGVNMGIQPTGNRVKFSLMMLLKIAEDKIIEKRAHFDVMDIRRQLTGES
ncbi:ester cyclase [Variovorax sp. Root411]|uniref:ester cyclase n=1 Tax=Variovorax sp. Root411 TaxID=1736530 RepID=UPI0006F2B2D9|nr:ester cyclase [Variovorax sp. Root411]KQW64951.1 ester cyclase [Variovorax sp. Root411]